VERVPLASIAILSLRDEIREHVEGLGELAWRMLEAQIAKSSRRTARRIATICDRDELVHVHDELATALNKTGGTSSPESTSTRALAELLAGIRLLAMVGAETRETSPEAEETERPVNATLVVPAARTGPAAAGFLDRGRPTVRASLESRLGAEGPARTTAAPHPERDGRGTAGYFARTARGGAYPPLGCRSTSVAATAAA
jgi:hypothetical protein